jgi:hypothetical protein
MKTFCSWLAITALTWLMSGCASSKLALKLDIYGEDPNMAYLTAEQLGAYERALKEASGDIRDYAKDRRELGWRVYQLYESAFRLSQGEPPSSAESQSVTNRAIQ